jgi:hypothetical protein
MGNFRIVIEGVGAHGDDRTAKEGEALSIPPVGESGFKSPDQLATEAVALFKGKVTDLKATLTHWPGEPSEVVDDLVAMKRVKGQF